MGKPNVLAVDDKRSNLLALEAVLADDCNVLFAQSGIEAINMVRSRSDIDLVLLDVQMPTMDGFQTAEQLKRLPGAADLPIVFITAVYSEDPYIKRGYEVGGIDYFTKPFNPDLLRLKVRIYASMRGRAELRQAVGDRGRAAAENMGMAQALAESLEQITVGVLVADAGGRISHLTEEACRVLNAPLPVEDGYRDLVAWWSGPGAGPISAEGGLLARTIQLGESVRREPLELPGLDGKPRAVLISTLPLRSPQGRISGAIILIHDATRVREMEAGLDERIHRLLTRAGESDAEGLH